jgi:hypothetical protein
MGSYEEKWNFMPLTAYTPLDRREYEPDKRSRPYSPDLPAGLYVYVQDCSGVVWTAPDGCHIHPKILGRAKPVVSAGELNLGKMGEVLAINNMSGTFQCASDSLFVALGGLVKQGAVILADALPKHVS